MKWILIILLISLTSCLGYYPGEVNCSMNPTPYNKTFDTCLARSNQLLTKLLVETWIDSCEKAAWKRTKFCY